MENPLLINLYRLPVRHINDYFVVVMMLKVLGLGLFFLCFFSKETSTKDVKGFYWRDFDGQVPDDAFEGGLDRNGKPIYIGQVYANFLIPAQIYSTGNKAYYEYAGMEYGVTENIKILCTQRPEQFEWISTDTSKINSITDKHLIIGGYEPGCTTYIGRIRQEGEILVGKALADNLAMYQGLHVTQKGKTAKHTAFEVLAFNPKIQLLDVRSC